MFDVHYMFILEITARGDSSHVSGDGWYRMVGMGQDGGDGTLLSLA